MEATLIVIGLNHRTASVEVRERFWISEGRRHEALQELTSAPSVCEAIVLATCNRTEFILWASEATAAANAVRNFLVRRYALRLCDWMHFYRHAGLDAVRHLFRVTSGLDSMLLGEPQIVAQVKAAWNMAHQSSACGRLLDAVIRKALGVSKRVRTETAIGANAVSVPSAAVELGREICGPLDGRKILILGAGKMGELSARYLLQGGAATVFVANRTFQNAVELAERIGASAVRFEDRWRHLADADIVISATGCPHVVLDRADAERIRAARSTGGAADDSVKPIYFIDTAVPRDIDPAVREVPGVFLYDLDDLDRIVARNMSGRQAAAREAEELVAREAADFMPNLAAESVVPTIVALRERLDEIGRQEIQRYRRECGESPAGDVLEQITARLVRRIAGTLARELKQAAAEQAQETMPAAVRRLFQLQAPVQQSRIQPESA